MINTGDTIIIAKGCRARGVSKGQLAKVELLTPLGKDYSHAIRVVLRFWDGRKIAFYARHVNRLGDAVVALNDGNPLHRIDIRK